MHTTHLPSRSVQYLQQPERVFAEVHRVLRPGGVAIFTFSNRMFYTKALAAWRDASGYARCLLVMSYFQSVRGFTAPEILTSVERRSSGAPAQQGGLAALLPAPLRKLLQRASSDPFYAVVAYKEQPE